MIITADFGVVLTRDRRIDILRVDGADIGVRFMCHCTSRGVHGYYYVEDDPDGNQYGNRIFAIKRAFDLSME